ncbi:protein priB [Cladorrhinum sp. PSN332]|nr:protein priB [Cladorrhinum sp. PSN332]
MESILDHSPTSAPAAAVAAPSSSNSKVSKGPRACATCARAKSRCVPGPEGQGKCERCHRLGKSCSSQTPAPPRKRKEPKPTRVAELERRIEDLTALVKPQQLVPSPPSSEVQHGHHSLPLLIRSVDPTVAVFPKGELAVNVIDGAPKCNQVSWSEPMAHLFPAGGPLFEGPGDRNQYLYQHQHRTDSSAPASSIHSLSPDARLSSPPNQKNAQPQVAENLWPEGDEAEELLCEYRNHMGHLFPFAVISSTMASEVLREQRPFLWKAVMVEACHHDGSRQIVLGLRLLKEVAEAAFMRSQTTLDLLQGVQLLISWYHFNLDKYQTTNLLFLMRSITTTLGFEASVDDNNWTSESLERMRAFAGTYYLATIASTTNKNPDHLTASPYLNKCVHVLKDKMEYETDELLIYLVHAQYITQWTSRAIVQHRSQPRTHQHPYALIENFRQSIRTFAESLPVHIKTNPSIVGHIHVAELLLYEGVIQQAQAVSAGYSNMQDGDTVVSSGGAHPAQVPSHELLGMLWACTSVVKAFLTNRFAQQMGDWPRFVCMSSLDFTYVFLTMLKLMTLRLPGWDLRKVRVELDFEKFVTRQIEDMDYTAKRRKKRSKSRVSGGGGNSSSHNSPMGVEIQEGSEVQDLFAKLAHKIRTLKNCVVSESQDRDIDSGQGPSDLSRVYDPAPMTLTDATQDLMQDLLQDFGNEIWGDMDIEWNTAESLFVNESMFDWSAAFGSSQPFQGSFQGYQI